MPCDPYGRKRRFDNKQMKCCSCKQEMKLYEGESHEDQPYYFCNNPKCKNYVNDV